MKNEGKRGVIAIVFAEEGSKVLVIKRRDVPIWVLPGGGVDPQETPEEAVIREVFEETGLHVSIKRHVATYLPINRLAHLTYLYECIQDAGALVTGNETREVGFYLLDTLPQPFFFLHRSWIEDASKQFPYPIKKHLTEVNYWNLFCYFCKNPLQVFRHLLSRMGKPYNSK